MSSSRDPLSLSLDDLIAQRARDWQGSGNSANGNGNGNGNSGSRVLDSAHRRPQPVSLAIKASTSMNRRQSTARHSAPYGFPSSSSSSFPHSHSHTQSHLASRGRERERERERERKSEHNYECAFKFLLPNHLTGTLIGNGGSSVRELMDITDAAVHVAKHGDFFPGTKERAIYITGAIAAVNLAQSLVWEMIGQQTHARENLSLESSAEWDPARAKASPGEFDDVSVTGKVTIPAAAGGLIIGRGGSTVRSLASDCHVEVKIDDKEDAELTQERVITLNGSVAGCMKCTSLILHKLKENNLMQYHFQGTGYGKLAKLQTESSASVSGGNGHRDHRDLKDHRDYRDRDDEPRSSSLGRSVALALGDPAIFDPRVKTGVCAETLSAHTTIELAVPDAAIGALLGAQGMTLHEIISLSGAKVVVSKRGEFVEGTTNRLVTIVGSPACAQTAHTLIIHKLKQSTHDD